MHVYETKKRATSEMNRSTHTLSILKEYGWSKPRVCLEAGWSMLRVCLEPAKALRPVMTLLLMLTLGTTGAWGQTGPVEITTDANGNGTIEDSEKKLYLIQTNAFPSFYIAPQDKNNDNNWTITTNNILGEYMLWYFLDAGKDNGTQYYYIVNNSTGKYVSHGDGSDNNNTSRGVPLVVKDQSNDESCKFKLDLNESMGAGFYNINVKGNQNYYALNKRGGSMVNTNPIQLTNNQYINNIHSLWKFIPFNGTFTYPTPPFTLSTDSDKHYYEIHNIQKDTHYAATDATPDKVIFTNQANESRAWYLKEAASDSWYKYYYIINPATGGKYMYYDGDADDTSDQTSAVSVKAYDSNNEDRYQFVVVQAARGDGNGRVTCYAIIPKLLIDNLWTSSSLGYAQASITDGLNMGIINSRGDTNGAHWEFKPTLFNTECANPVIAFDRTTGKASITTTTLLPKIYYTTDGTEPSSTNGTLYGGAFALTEQTTVKAIVTKDGYTDSEVTTLTIYKVATPTIQQETGTHNVSITTATPGATIYYTVDGTTPTTTSTLYTGASEELGGKPIKAIAVKDGMINSDVGEGTVDVRCATPVISFNNITSMVTITCGTEGSTLRYTIDNSEPTATSTAYSGPFAVTSPTTVKAIATHEDLDLSVVAELVIPQVATPTIQNYGSNAVSITTTTLGSTIYYTTDGSTPTTTSGTVYTVPLTENISGVTIKAIAVKEGMITSAVGSGTVTLQCATPVIARSGRNGFTISCSFPASDVTIYYTTDGTTPTTSSSSIIPGDIVPCTLPITINAMAVATNYENSEVATANLKDGMEGEGTVDNPYTIKYQVDVEDFVEHANTPEGASLYYKVIATEPLDFSEAAPITQAFSGTFDGGTQTITGLTHPLFNTVDGGVVKNVTLKNVAIESDAEYVGAIAGVAQGYSRIYNCGILPNDATFPEGTHPTVTGGTCAGGIVGKLDGDSRVINCYSYADVSASTYAAGIVGQNTFESTAEVSSGKYTKLKTAVVNCMFYGNITGGTNQYGVYGGSLITNAAATGISSYNYYRSGSTFTTGEPTAYNCSFPADERYLTQVEFHRSLLNSNRELCGWWVGSDVAPSTLTTAEVQAIPKDASLMYKWVVDPNLAPYPILKPFGKYPSIINTNTGTPWFDRTTAAPFEGQQLGTLSVYIKKSSTDTNPEHLNIPITDMDSLHYDFGYRKIQLPYYNTVFGNPNGATWQEKYAGNYTSQVVTGWKITNVSGGNEGSFVADWQYGYNFADRNCTDKDLYSVSGRVFAQGGYYYVPDDVTEITIEAYWGKAIYVRNDGGYYDRVNITLGSTGTAFAPAGIRANNVNNATIQTTSIKETLTAANIDAKKTVYDYALVLVGNVQESVGQNHVTHKTEATRGFTIMSVDLDFDEEPDYCLEWQLGKEMKRQEIAPIRFDFLPVVELGIAGKLHNSTNFFSLGCYRSRGHFEVTETAFIRFGQFEFELGTRDDGPVILNGGIYDQYCRGRNSEINQHINYVILGGHIVMPSFTPGAHVNGSATYQTRHCAVNVLGGDFTSFYLTGGYNEGIKPYEDNPHCYIDGGRFGTIAAAYKEGIWGDVTWRINHALIGEFYGGGVMAQATGDTYKIVKGSIDVVIDNSIVGKYCGGPKFGDMVSGKTVRTSATGTIFNQFFGAGNGGTNYMQYKNTDATGDPISDWSSTINSNYTPGNYRNKAQGYEANYDLEVINYSTGDGNGKFVNRSYYYSAQFATTNTGNVTSTLTDCTINTNFYGGGFLGGVTGNVTSTLNNCTVNGAVFGAGYSASAGTVNIYNKDKVPPVPNTYTGMIKPQSGGTFTTYEWTNNKTFETKTLSTGSPTILNPNDDGKNYIYTEVSLQNLGAVSGNVTLTINGTTTVGESVYGGGDESAVSGNVAVYMTDGTVGENVFGGGNQADVKGNATVTMTSGSVGHSIYGGGNLGTVGNVTARSLPAGHPGHSNCCGGKPTAFAENTGMCTVVVSGGSIGPDNMKMPDDYGYVFGAGRGMVEDPAVNPDIDFIAYVNNTDVTISGTAFIKGSVYGGSENGRVLNDTHVKIQGGQIGNGCTNNSTGASYNRPYNTEEWNSTSLPECAHWVYGEEEEGKMNYHPYDKYSAHDGASTAGSDGHTFYGNVFGGGSGLFPYEKVDGEGNGTGTYEWLRTAGRVEGNTRVTITGGHILTSVYGGCELTDVGNGLTVEDDKGKCTVEMTGGTLGVPRTLDEILAHPVTCYLFGAGKGDQRIHFNQWTNVGRVEVTITDGARIYGSVFGGGEDGHVLGDVTMTIGKDGEGAQPVIGTLGTSYVDGNIFGGGRGFGGDALTAGVVSGNVTIDIKGGTMLGSIYGGGRLGSVGTYLVPSTDAKYGLLIDNGKQQTINETTVGNGTVDVSDASGVTHGNITINVSGGTIGNTSEYVYPTDAEKTGLLRNTTFAANNRLLYTKGGNIFTGCMGRLYGLDGTSLLPHWGGMAKARKTTLNITGGTIKSNVYGGGEMGTLAEGATINITGGTIGTQVPAGAGDGETAYYYGSVFGGGKGSTDDITGKWPAGTEDAAKTDISMAGQVGGDVLVELNNGVADNAKGGIVHQIFGCNDMNGSPKGNVTVHVYKTQNEVATQIANTAATAETPAVDDAKVKERYDVEAVYGGGNLAAYKPFGPLKDGTPEDYKNTTKVANVIIDGCDRTSIRTVYGGGNAATTPATQVDINGTYEVEEVFGGGNGKDKIPHGDALIENPGANVGYYNYSTFNSGTGKWDDNSDADTKDKRLESSYVYGTGEAKVNIYGGTVHRVFGGSNTKGNVRIVAVTLLDNEDNDCDFLVDEAYGGGKSAPMDGAANLVMACIPGLKAAYGGAQNAEIEGDVNLTITNGTFEKVFGGNDQSGYIKGSITVNIEETGCKPVIIGELYGGGNDAPYTAPDAVSPTLNVRSFTSIGNVFGGGYGSEAIITGNPHVNINVCEGLYATPREAMKDLISTELTRLEGLGYTLPTHEDGKIGAINNVYGGGNAADVIGDTHVSIGTKTKEDIVFETPKTKTVQTAGSDTPGDTSDDVYVEQNTTDEERKHEVKGADIRGNVFGGGNAAEVTGNTDVIIGK